MSLFAAAAPALTLAEGNSALTGLSIVFGVLLVVALVASMFPAIRKANALFAPILVLLTLAVTALAVGGVVVLIHRLDLL